MLVRSGRPPCRLLSIIARKYAVIDPLHGLPRYAVHEEHQEVKSPDRGANRLTPPPELTRWTTAERPKARKTLIIWHDIYFPVNFAILCSICTASSEQQCGFT